MSSNVVVVKIGVLAIQGAFIEHINMLRSLNEHLIQDNIIVEPIEIRTACQLNSSKELKGLIIPGGESTTISLVAKRLGLWDSLHEWVHSGKPTWGTCAGLIMLSNQATHTKKDGQPLLGGFDIFIDRNYYGSQTDSFVYPFSVSQLFEQTLHSLKGDNNQNEHSFNGIFIRAPMITSVQSENVKILATLSKEARKDRSWTEDPVIAIQQNNLLGTTFHPELTNDYRWHLYFLRIILSQLSENN